jgi:outer membrane cobalamin receptor
MVETLMRIYSITIILLLSTHLLFGQTDSVNLFNILNPGDLKIHPKTEILEVVSASRTNKDIEKLPMEIYVVMHEDIINNNCYSLVDVLKIVPGIKFSQPGSGQMGEEFYIRGFTGNQYTKILINGISVKPTVVSGMPIGRQLPIRQAERIEIILGSTAAVYGANAVSGVINIILKEAAQGAFVRGDVSLGEKGYNYVNFMIGGKAGKNNNILKYSFYGSKDEFPNMNIALGHENAYNPLLFFESPNNSVMLGGTMYNMNEITPNLLQQHNITTDEFINEHYMPYYEGDLTQPLVTELGSSSHQLGLNLNYRGLRIEYSKMYRKTHSSIGQSPLLLKFNDPNTYWGEAISRTLIGYETQLGDKLSSSTTMSLLSYQMDNRSSISTTFIAEKKYRFSASNDYRVEQFFTWGLSKSIEIVSGIEYVFSENIPITNFLDQPFTVRDIGLFRRENIPSDPILGRFGYNVVSFNNFSVFGQAYYMKQNSTFVLGGRYDLNSLYGNSLSPRIGLLRKITERLKIYSSLGFGYKAPPTSLIYESLAYILPETIDSVNYLIIPNKNLHPERFIEFDIGFRRKFFDKWHISLLMFYNEINNLILNQNRSVAEFNLYQASAWNDSVIYRSNFKQAVSRVYGVQGVVKINDIIEEWNLDLEGSAVFSERNTHLPHLRTISNWFLNFESAPKHFGKVKLSMEPVKNLYIGINSSWYSTWFRNIIHVQDVDGYFSMDFHTNYHLNSNLRIYIDMINLFDRKYYGSGTGLMGTNNTLNPQYRRNIRIGLTYKLN